jgi:gamma-butyrobetaine dioxygenase
MQRMSCISTIVELFDTRGHAEYLGEPVSQREHALQCAYLAHKENASDSLIAAALLHDIGHLLPNGALAPNGDDRIHEEIAAQWLKPHFGPEVTEPIRLHVLAKRYLCTVESSYYAGLSQASLDSLKLQGGLLSVGQATEFEGNPHFEAALRVRRWDEAAKEPALVVPNLNSYLSLLGQLELAVTDF